MPKPKHYISEAAAIELLKRLFNSSTTDSLTLNEVYEAAGRGSFDDETNRNWLNTVMTKLRYHNLIAPEYKYDGRKKLDRVKLTIAAKTVLGRANQPTAPTNSTENLRIVTPQTVYDDIEILKKQNPGFKIGLIFEPKDKPMSK